MNTKIITITSTLLLAASLAIGSGLASAATYTPLTGQMGVGATGNNVIALQTFLTSNPWIYPEARITGYYGPLTAKAVAQFQVNYDIPMVGRVGPMTLAKINSLILTNLNIDISAPGITNTSVQVAKTSATVSWATNESAKGKVYYSATPLQLREAFANFMEPIVMGGASVAENATAWTSQNVTLQNLQPGTVYYYMIVSTDSSGNVSVSVPASFVTNP